MTNKKNASEKGLLLVDGTVMEVGWSKNNEGLTVKNVYEMLDCDEVDVQFLPNQIVGWAKKTSEELEAQNTFKLSIPPSPTNRPKEIQLRGPVLFTSRNESSRVTGLNDVQMDYINKCLSTQMLTTMNKEQVND